MGLLLDVLPFSLPILLSSKDLYYRGVADLISAVVRLLERDINRLVVEAREVLELVEL